MVGSSLRMKVVGFLGVALWLVGLLGWPASATLGVDVSDSVSSSDFSCLQKSSYDFAIVRCFQSSGHPDPNCPGTVKNAHSANVQRVDIYMFPCAKCSESGAQQVQATNSNLDKSQYSTFWFDIENTAYWPSQSASQAFFEDMVNEGKKLGLNMGVYTSSSQWEPIMGSSYSGGSSLPLWYAHYDGQENFNDFQAFGGWNTPTMKQYQGDQTVCGVGVDENYATSITYSNGASNSQSSGSSGKSQQTSGHSSQQTSSQHTSGHSSQHSSSQHTSSHSSAHTSSHSSAHSS